MLPWIHYNIGAIQLVNPFHWLHRVMPWSNCDCWVTIAMIHVKNNTSLLKHKRKYNNSFHYYVDLIFYSLQEFLALCEFIQSLVQKKFFDRRHFVCGVYNVSTSNMLRVNMSTDLSVCVNQVISSVPVEMYWVLFKSRLITIQDLDYTRSVHATIMLMLQFLYMQ